MTVAAHGADTGRVLNMLGLCYRAGKLTVGLDACEKAIRAGKARLALIDEAASANSRKAIDDACKHRGVPLAALPGSALGDAVGKPGRMAAVVTDAGFAQRITLLLNQQRD